MIPLHEANARLSAECTRIFDEHWKGRKPDAELSKLFRGLEISTSGVVIVNPTHSFVGGGQLFDPFLEVLVDSLVAFSRYLDHRPPDDDAATKPSPPQQATSSDKQLKLPIKIVLRLENSNLTNGNVLTLATSVLALRQFSKRVAVTSLYLSKNVHISTVGGKRLKRLAEEYPWLVTIAVEECAVNDVLRRSIAEACQGADANTDLLRADRETDSSDEDEEDQVAAPAMIGKSADAPSPQPNIVQQQEEVPLPKSTEREESTEELSHPDVVPVGALIPREATPTDATRSSGHEAAGHLPATEPRVPRPPSHKPLQFEEQHSKPRVSYSHASEDRSAALLDATVAFQHHHTAAAPVAASPVAVAEPPPSVRSGPSPPQTAKGVNHESSPRPLLSSASPKLPSMEHHHQGTDSLVTPTARSTLPTTNNVPTPPSEPRAALQEGFGVATPVRSTIEAAPTTDTIPPVSATPHNRAPNSSSHEEEEEGLAKFPSTAQDDDPNSTQRGVRFVMPRPQPLADQEERRDNSTRLSWSGGISAKSMLSALANAASKSEDAKQGHLNYFYRCAELSSKASLRAGKEQLVITLGRSTNNGNATPWLTMLQNIC